MSNSPVYLDYAAATPVDPRVFAAMQPYFTDRFYNPSANYLAAKAIAADVQKARQSVAHWLGAKPSEIVFTAGGTEANNLALSGIMEQFPESNLVVSAIEHESVRVPARQYDHREVPVTKQGIIDLAELERAIDRHTVLVSVIYANNEIGTIQPLKEIASLLQKIKKQRRIAGESRPLYLHTDACQAANYLDLHVAKLGIDMMTLNGGKVYGPKQSGVLYIKTGVIMEPQIRGGGQERGLRSGTENVAGVVGFAEALDITQRMRSDESQRLTSLRNEFTGQIPEATINGSLKKRLPNNISVTFPEKDNERLMMQLDEVGIIVAVGSACSAGKEESSHVLRAIGLSDEDARATLRISMGRQTTKAAINRAMKALKEILDND